MTNDNATPTAAGVSTVEAGWEIALEANGYAERHHGADFSEEIEAGRQAWNAYRAHVDERERLLLAFVERVAFNDWNPAKNEWYDPSIEARNLLVLLAATPPPADTSARSEAT